MKPMKKYGLLAFYVFAVAMVFGPPGQSLTSSIQSHTNLIVCVMTVDSEAMSKKEVQRKIKTCEDKTNGRYSQAIWKDGVKIWPMPG